LVVSGERQMMPPSDVILMEPGDVRELNNNGAVLHDQYMSTGNEHWGVVF
jgi:hypothetical protein